MNTSYKPNETSRHKKRTRINLCLCLFSFFMFSLLFIRQPPETEPCIVAETLTEFPPSSRVPRVVHQQWWNGKINPPHSEWHTQTKLVLKDYKHILWSVNDMRNLIVKEYPWFTTVFDNYPSNMHRADAARYFILYLHGGIYIDMDYVPQIDIYRFLSPNGPTFLESPFWYNEKVGSALIASPPGHPFWKTMFNVLEERRYFSDVVQATGPGALTAALSLWEKTPSASNIHILPCENFFRVPMGDTGAHTYLPARIVRSVVGRTRFVKNCGSISQGCLYGVHYNTMLYLSKK